MKSRANIFIDNLWCGTHSCYASVEKEKSSLTLDLFDVGLSLTIAEKNGMDDGIQLGGFP